MRSFIFSSLLALGLASAGSVAAFAAGNLEVTETNTPSVTLNQSLEAKDQVDLPDGAKIMLFNKITEKSAVCAGPYKGPVGDCPGEKKCGLIWRLLGRCGATQTQTPGGTRGVHP
jgi:hypothetical protein